MINDDIGNVVLSYKNIHAPPPSHTHRERERDIKTFYLEFFFRKSKENKNSITTK